MSIKEQAHQMKLDAAKLAATTNEERNKALAAAGAALEAHKSEIFEANAKDLAAAEENGVAPAVMKRLKFDEHKLADVLAGIAQLQELADPLGKKLLSRQLDEGLNLYRISVPIGVIGVIFEARPDALVQISTLCIKSGNCAILKGGKETANTNRALFHVIYQAVTEAGMPAGCLLQAEAHSEIDELLQCDKDVDLLIPRGSNAFVRYIMDHTKIPVMGHADGVCHIYVDKDADFEKTLPILVDAKTQYTAACNAVETILVHKDIAADFLPKMAKALKDAGVNLRGTAEVVEMLGAAEKEEKAAVTGKAGETAAAGEAEKTEEALIDSTPMAEDEFHTEYLALTASVKLVVGVEEAVNHINRFGSHHTDAIMTENSDTAEYFMQCVDSAGVYQNCSTRFADGFRYGFGAEVGISTSKIHARGPVGLDGLVTYKYRLYGSGQIVGDYANGKAQFHFKDL